MKDGGTAFPFVADEHGDGEPGMSLRDWFAGMALATDYVECDPAPDSRTASMTAERAYEVADAMLKRRSENEP